MPSCGWISGTAPQVVYCIEGSGTQTYKAGDLVKWSAGTVVIATNGYVDGIARRDAQGVTSSDAEIELINLDSIYIVKKNTTTAQTDIGSVGDFTFTPGGHVCTLGGAGNDCVCVGLDQRDAIGVSGGRLLVQFKPGATLKA
jgi:hypothetical protein